MITAHAAAVLSAIGGADVQLYDGEVPEKPVYPYVVVFTAAPLLSAGRLTGNQDTGLSRFLTKVVGKRLDQVRAAQDRVRAQLVDQHLPVTGRISARVKNESSQPIANELTPDPAVFVANDEWSLVTFPTS